jgi:hypothetical protein
MKPPTTSQSTSTTAAIAPYGDYIVYVDESGDHSLVSVSPEFPLFVLAFCIFRKSDYVTQVVPAAQQFKFDQFGHDIVVLHEREVRKAEPPFDFLTDAARRLQFMTGLNTLVSDAPFTIIAVVIRKEQLVGQYADPANPYHLAMEHGLERVCSFLQECGQSDRVTHVVFECRGTKEDTDLELAFRRVTASNTICQQAPVEIVFSHKHANSTGLQIADLVARPIGRKVLKPKSGNRAYDILQAKFRRSPDGQIDGWGLKCFP